MADIDDLITSTEKLINDGRKEIYEFIVKNSINKKIELEDYKNLHAIELGILKITQFENILKFLKDYKTTPPTF